MWTSAFLMGSRPTEFSSEPSQPQSYMRSTRDFLVLQDVLRGFLSKGWDVVESESLYVPGLCGTG